MNTTDIARRIYWIARKNDEAAAVEIIKGAIRDARQEGIRVGLDQCERHADVLNRSGEHAA